MWTSKQAVWTWVATNNLYFHLMTWKFRSNFHTPFIQSLKPCGLEMSQWICGVFNFGSNFGVWFRRSAECCWTELLPMLLYITPALQSKKKQPLRQQVYIKHTIHVQNSQTYYQVFDIKLSSHSQATWEYLHVISAPNSDPT